MPFQERRLSTLPTRTPDVEIIFHGQLLMQSDGTGCEIAVNPLALNHVLSIEARTRVPGQPDVIHMRHWGPLHFRQPEGMTIQINPQSDTRAAWKCVGETSPNHQTGVGAPPDDFRWILNLEGALFHNTNVVCPLFNNRQHVIRLLDGEYFFRTGLRAPAGLRFVRKLAGQNPADFRRIGAIARVSAFLNPTQTLVLTWHDGTQEQVLPLDKPPQNGVHEVYIENTPLFIDPAVAIGHDELAEYYKVLDVPPAQRFTFTTIRETIGAFDRGTPTIPCQVIRLDEPPND